MSDNQVLDEIKTRLDLAETIGKEVTLKRAGSTLKGLCPFHTEKTPSFVVFPHSNTWHCFGCGEGGDIFSFVMKRENLSFSEALHLLARQAGVELRKPDEADIAAAQEREQLLALLSTAATTYHQWLIDGERGGAARNYLERRKISPATVEQFQLGYAPPQWDGLLKTLTSRGIQPAALEKVGLVIARENGGYYDRFRHRLLFPIRDPQGKVIGFGGRALDDETQPKYLNSPQTPLFDKGRVLFGLDVAREAIRKADNVIIVEGYMDVLTAHQHGFQNVIASMGTALTREQFRTLKRLTRSLVFALDADQAGSTATQRGLERAREALDQKTVPVITSRGLVRQEHEVDADIHVLVLPEGMDPDDLIKQRPAQWQQLVQSALPVVDYLFSRAIRDFDPQSAKAKSHLTEELLPVIADILDPVQRVHYLQKLAQLVRVDERVLDQQLARTRRHRAGTAPATDEEEQVQASMAFGLEEYCLFLLLVRPALFETVEQYGLTDSDFQRVENREIFIALKNRGPEAISLHDNPLDEEAFIESLDSIVANHLRNVIRAYESQPPIPTENLQSEVEVAAQSLRLRNENKELSEITLILRTVSEEKAPSEKENALWTRIVELHRSIRSREQDLYSRTYAGHVERYRQSA
ncbi:MAG: DNA primase [Chloroflexi bacterium]|nr:DNA primase [Chloroflexota bacterium]